MAGDQDEVNLLLDENLFQAREKIRERLGENKFQRLCDGLGFITHRDADALASVIRARILITRRFLQKMPGVASRFNQLDDLDKDGLNAIRN